MKWLSKIFLLFSFPFIAEAQGTFPLQVETRINPPYPTHLSDFTDFDSRTFIDIINPSSQTYEIILIGELTNVETGLSIRTNTSNLPTSCITVFPGINSLEGSDLGALFDPDHLLFEGISETRIRADKALPEGMYSLCLRAVDCRNPLRALSSGPEFFSGCASWDMSYLDPPVVIAPICDEEVNQDFPSIPIRWIWMPPISGSENVRFNLRIVELDPPDRNPYDALISGTTPELFYAEEIEETYYNLNVPDEVILRPGYKYAIQVEGYDREGELVFKNEGLSEPCVFSYGSSTQVKKPVWLAENNQTISSGESVFEPILQVEMPEGTEFVFDLKFEVAQIPPGVDPSDAFTAENITVENVMPEIPFSEGISQSSWAIELSRLTAGSKYGVRASLLNPPTDFAYFENDGVSDVLVFNYGESGEELPAPEWISEDGQAFPEGVHPDFELRQNLPEGNEIILNYTFTVANYDGGDKNEAFNTPSNIVVKRTISEFVVTAPFANIAYAITDLSSLTYGQSYVIRAEVSGSTAFTFANGGKSPPLVFHYRESSSSTTTVNAVFPENNSQIPFNFFPLVVRYEPYDDSWQHFSSEVSIFRGSTLEDTHNRSLRWPGGSYEAQRSLPGLNNITRDQSQNVAVYKNNAESPITFVKGETYRWETGIELYKTVNTTGTPENFNSTASFTHGMGPSKLNAPGWGAVIKPDSSLAFQWLTADAPEHILPTFVRQSEGGTLSYFNGIIYEKWVLEVSRSEEFDSLVFVQSGTIGDGRDYLSEVTTDPSGVDYLPMETVEANIKADIYKDLTATEKYAPSDTGYYYWRVKWLKDPTGDVASEAYESSQIRPFYVGTSPPGTTTRSETPPGGCISDCLSPEITNTTAVSGLSVGDKVKVGKFDMVVKTVSGSGNRYSGDGEIRVQFLNNVRIKVDFQSIRVNAGGQMIDGKITAAKDVPSISMDSSSVNIGGRNVSIPTMNDTESEALEAAISGTERLVSFLTDERAMGMPLGLDNEIDGVTYLIGITEMEFSANKATLTAAMQLDIPSIGNYIPALGAKGVCFNPDGLGDEGRLYLYRDHLIYDGDFAFSFAGAESGDTTRATYVEWDCQGFKCASVRGNVEFPEDWMVPEDEDGNIVEGRRVKADFGAKFCRGNNWIADVGIEAFQVKGLNGWGFLATRAYLDFSGLENPASLRFPATYDQSHLSVSGSGSGSSTSSRLVNAWQGFYLETLMARAPSDFEHDVLGRAEFGLSNLIIDKSGISVNVEGRNIIAWEDGSVDNLSFSLDSVKIEVVQSSLRGGGLKGKLGLPLFADGDQLHYEGLVAVREDSFAINFRVVVRDTLNVPMWQSEMFLQPDSEIGITHQNGSEGNKTYVYANLSGGVDLNGDAGEVSSSIPGLNMKGIRFQGLEFSSDGPRFDIDSFYVAHASPQKSMAGFPVGINNIGLNISNPLQPGLDFDVYLILSDAGFSAAAGFNIYGEFDLSGEREVFGFGGINLRSISISQEVNGISLSGLLEFYNSDPVYGNGVKGRVEVALPMDIAGQLTVQFGTYKNASVSNPEFNSRDYYAYWFVDGLIRFPGVPIFSGFGIYGFGGGAYYNMRRDDSGSASGISLTGDGEEEPSSGTRYIPDFETLGGIKFTAVLGTHPKPDAFNMDVTVQMEFTRSRGLGLFSIEGNGFVMVGFDKRPEAKIRADVLLRYINPADGSERFDGHFDIYVDYGDILHGVGSGNRFVHAAFLVQDDTWYYHMGTPTDRGGLEADIKILTARLDSYFMVGHGIPSTLPPLPERIARLIYGSGQGSLNSGGLNESAAESRERSPTEMSKIYRASGFAFGSSFFFETEFDFAIFYANMALTMGFDILVSEDEDRICFETGEAPGINNWYAQGQMYAGLEGEMGVKVDLFFIKGRFPFINLGAAVALRGGLPSPTWMEGRAGLYYSVLNGLVEGQCNFKVQIGQKCSIVDANPFSDIEFIASTLPEEGDTDVNVFASPQVYFALPINKLMELPAGLEDEPDKVRIFKPFIDEFKLFHTSEGNTNIPGSFIIDRTGTSATFEPDDKEALEGLSNYRFTVIIKAYELFPGGRRNLLDWEETRNIPFTTGPRPEKLVDENLAYTYPVSNQAYFLQNETNKGKGIIQYLRRSQNYLFEPTIDGRNYNYSARFKSVDGGGEELETPVEVLEDGLMFNIPTLENSTYYTLQIVRVPQRTRTLADMVDESSLGGALASDTRNLSPIWKTFDAGTLKVNIETKMPGEVVRSGETLLYHYYFRTSQFNSLQEKLNVFDPSVSYVGGIFESLKLEGNSAERFDNFEIKGYFKDGVKILNPLLEMTAPFNHPYHRDRVYPKIYGLREELLNIKYRDSDFSGMYISRLNSHRQGLPPTHTVTFSSDNTVGDPVQTWEIEREAGITRNSGSGSSTTSTSTTSEGTGTISSGASFIGSTSSSLGTSSLLSGVTSIMNGYGSSIVSSTGSGLYLNMDSPGAREENFDLYYATSLFVKLDAGSFRRNLSSIISNRTPRYASYLIREYPDTFLNMLRTISTRPNYYNYQNGNYSIRLNYLAPKLSGIGSGRNNRQQRSSSTSKTFSY